MARNFVTSKGSIYVVFPDGTTSRHKAQIYGHEGDSGAKERSEKTVYVPEGRGSSLSTATVTDPLAGGAPKARVVLSNGTVTLITWNYRENRWGATADGRNVPYSETPQVGWEPLELWRKTEVPEYPGYEAFKKMHSGHPITEIDVDEDERTAELRAAHAAEESESTDVEAATRGAETADPARTAGRTGAANAGTSGDWYAEFRDLNNRRDMLREGGGGLPPDQEERWRQLNDRLMQEAYGTGGGKGGDDDFTLDEPPSAPSAGSPLTDEVVKVLTEAIKRFGQNRPPETPEPIPPSGPVGATEYQYQGPSSGGGYVRGPGPPEPPDEHGLTADVPPQYRPQSGTPAFDRPQPVIVMGPRPLPVTVVNLDAAMQGLRGGKTKEEEEKPKKSPIREAFEHMWSVLEQPSAGNNQSGSNLARFLGRMTRIGRGFKDRASNALGLNRRRKKTKPSLWDRFAFGLSRAGPAGTGASAAGGVGAAGGAAGVVGVLGGAATATVAFTAAVIEAGKATYEFARAQEREIRKLAEVGPQQAAAVARLDAERTMRQVQTAQETGGTSEQAIESLDRLEKSMRPFESALTNLSNIVSSIASDVLSDILEFLEPITNGLNALTEALGGKVGEKNKPPEVAFDALARAAAETARINSPQWPQGDTENPWWPKADHPMGQR